MANRSTPRIGAEVTGPDSERFKITDFLGNGAFGEVYRASGNSSGRIVAVKLLPVNDLDDENSRTALINEVKAAAQVRHPNVVEVLHVAENSPELGPYVVMEYISGGTLARLLRAQRQASVLIPPMRVLAMMADVAQGARAVNAKLIHRDIKADNILIEGDTLKIGDFGISKLIDQSTRLRTFKGGQHIAYMAPEGWQGAKNTVKLDTYAVGLLFYQIATLKHPFEDAVPDFTDWRGWERAHLFEPCPNLHVIRPDLGIAIAQLVDRMAAKRPDERPDWEEVLRILTTPDAILGGSDLPSVDRAVQAAIRRKQEQDKVNLRSEEESLDAERKTKLYFHACEELLTKFEAVVASFNSKFQHGTIKVSRRTGLFDQPREVDYAIPGGRTIIVRFFLGQETRVRVRGGQIVGGGLIRIGNGRGANLVFLRQGENDLYGHWAVCELNLMALADPRKLVGRFGLTEGMPLPFGFESSKDFYEQMAFSTGIMHVFTYNFIDDPKQFFGDLLEVACE
jgi:eukaryotic-like serine/threonine-protein kinase